MSFPFLLLYFRYFISRTFSIQLPRTPTAYSDIDGKLDAIMAENEAKIHKNNSKNRRSTEEDSPKSSVMDILAMHLRESQNRKAAKLNSEKSGIGSGGKDKETGKSILARQKPKKKNDLVVKLAQGSNLSSKLSWLCVYQVRITVLKWM